MNTIICKKSFTFHNGKIITKTTNPLFIKGNEYQYIIEDNGFIWIKSDNENTYGPGTRINFNKENVSTFQKDTFLTSDYFHNIKTSNRDRKLKMILNKKPSLD